MTYAARILAGFAISGSLGLWPWAGLAQDTISEPAPVEPEVTIPTPILTIDQDRLYAESAFGRRVKKDLETASAALAAENREIESRLTAEEKDLTAKRATLPAADFRKLADEFDTRVEGIRASQDEKSKNLTAGQDALRQTFLNAALPILSDIVRQSGAVAILDSRVIFLASDRINITDKAIAAIDAAIGDGADLPVAEPGAAPATSPQPAP